MLRRAMTKSTGWSSKKLASKLGMEARALVFRRLPQLSRTMDQRNCSKSEDTRGIRAVQKDRKENRTSWQWPKNCKRKEAKMSMAGQLWSAATDVSKR